jgi:membrane protein
MGRKSADPEPGSPGEAGFLKTVYTIWVLERPTQLAAALAYFGLFSFAPIIYVAISVAGLFVDKVVALERLLSRTEALLGPSAAEGARQLVESVSAQPPGSPLVGLISAGLILYTATGVFYQLQYALNSIWKLPFTRADVLRRTLRERLISLVIVLSLGLMLVLVAVIGLVPNWLPTDSLLGNLIPVLAPAGYVLIATLAFAVLYKVLPATRIAWRDVWAGAATAAILMAVGIRLVVFFLGSAQMSSALQAAGAFVVLLTSFYYFAQIFLLGAIITRVYAQRHGSMRAKQGDPRRV